MGLLQENKKNVIAVIPEIHTLKATKALTVAV
jgi:hypothetical protein